LNNVGSNNNVGGVEQQQEIWITTRGYEQPKRNQIATQMKSNNNVRGAKQQ
jgi:hypothetical protein